MSSNVCFHCNDTVWMGLAVYLMLDGEERVLHRHCAEEIKRNKFYDFEESDEDKEGSGDV